MGGLDSTQEARHDDPTQQTPDSIDSTGFLPVTGFLVRSSVLVEEDDDCFGFFEPRPVVQFSNRPPKVVEDIYKSLPSVAMLFPEWPFQPPQLPPSSRAVVHRKAFDKIKKEQNYGHEPSVTRVYAPGTAAHRLLNHSFKQDVKDFSAEYETFRMNGFQGLSDDKTKATEAPTPYMFGVSRYNPQLHNPEFYTSNQGLAVKSADKVANLQIKVFKCSICNFSPRHDDIPNWLYLTKENDTPARYYYCIRCRGRDRGAKFKAITSLMAMVKDIVNICEAEQMAKEMGMDGVITSVPLARFKRYEIMFNIEVQAAMVRKALKEEMQWLLNHTENVSKEPEFSTVAQVKAKEILARYFTTAVPKLFDTEGLLGQPLSKRPMQKGLRYEQSRIIEVSDEKVNSPAKRSHTPATDHIYQSSEAYTPPGCPWTPVWIAGRPTTPSEKRPITPPGYPQRFTPKLSVSSSERACGAHIEDDESTDCEGVSPAEGVITGRLVATETCPSSSADSEPSSSARSSRTLYDFIPQNEDVSGTPDTLTHSSLTLPTEDGEAMTVIGQRFPRFYEIFTIEPREGAKVESLIGRPDPGQSLRSSTVERSSHPLSKGGIKANLPPKTERMPPERSERASGYKQNANIQPPPQLDRARVPKFNPKDTYPYPKSSERASTLNTNIEAQVAPKLNRETFYKYNPRASIPAQTERQSLSRPETTSQPAVQIGRASSSDTATRAAPPPKLNRETFYKYNPQRNIPHQTERRSLQSTETVDQPDVAIGQASSTNTAAGPPPPPKLNRETFYKCNPQRRIPPQTEHQSPHRVETISHPAVQIGQAASSDAPTEAPPPKPNRATFYKYNPQASAQPDTGRQPLYRTETASQLAVQIGEVSSSNSPARPAPPPSSKHRSFYKYNPNETIPPMVERNSFYKSNESSSQDSLSSIPEDKLEDHPESDFSDTSADWDSDDSFDEPLRRMSCLDLLDDLVPPRREESVRWSAKVWNSMPMCSNARMVDTSLEIMAEEDEPEEDEPVDDEPEEDKLEENEPKEEAVRDVKNKGKSRARD